MSQIPNNAKNLSRDALSSFLKFCQLLEVDEVSYHGLPIPNRDTDNYTILLSSTSAARELAYMLRGDWDGLNAVTIYKRDPIAIANALDLLKTELGQQNTEFCQSGKFCYLPEEMKKQLLAKAKKCGGSSVVITGLFLESLSGEIEKTTLELSSQLPSAEA